MLQTWNCCWWSAFVDLSLCYKPGVAAGGVHLSISACATNLGLLLVECICRPQLVLVKCICRSQLMLQTWDCCWWSAFVDLSLCYEPGLLLVECICLCYEPGLVVAALQGPSPCYEFGVLEEDCSVDPSSCYSPCCVAGNFTTLLSWTEELIHPPKQKN